MYLKTFTLFLLLFWSSQACSVAFAQQYDLYKYQTIGAGFDYRLIFKRAKDHFEQTDEQRLKADRIISLLNKENKAKKLELQQEKATRKVLTDTAFLLLITILLVYLSFRNTQNANLLLDKKNRQLDTLNEQLMAGNRTKAKLLGIISHDLRSPVSQLFTFMRLQQNRPGLLTEACKNQYQQELLLSSANLLATMEDLLLWSKSQMDHFTLYNEDVNIAHLLAALTRQLQAEAKDKKIILEIEKPEYQFVNSDYNLLFTILRNLLQNAVKHAFSETVILIGANINAQQQPYISIVNRGEMIPAEKIQKLINEVDINSKSSGYGLLIVKDLSAMIGAEFNICSTLEGTTTQVVFP